MTATVGILAVLGLFLEPQSSHLALSSKFFEQGHIWSVFTRVFLHVSWQHFSANLLFFLMLSVFVESQIKAARTLALFLALTAISGIVLLCSNFQGTSVGMSSVAHGYFAAAMMILALRKEKRIAGIMLGGMLVKFSLDWIGGSYALSTYTTGSDSGAIFWGHLAGALGGVLVISAMQLHRKKPANLHSPRT